jgi:hypothetical protein
MSAVIRHYLTLQLGGHKNEIARIVFVLAGIRGILITSPLYFHVRLQR